MNITGTGKEQFITRLSLIILLAIAVVRSHAQPDGEKIFKNNCAQCHKIDARLTGPPLRGAIHRVPNQNWLIDWVKNSQEVVNKGDEYAVKIFNENNKIIMPPQSLKDDEILAVFDYIEAAPKQDTSPATAESTKPGEQDAVSDNDIIILSLLALAMLLIIFVQSMVKKKLKRYIDEKHGRAYIPPKSSWESILYWIATHKKHTAFIVIVLMIASSVKGWYVLKGIGVYQGYAPEQPIRFSHKIHAGTNQINCVYCHSGAEKGRVAGIPPVNVCMNCHRAISSGKQWGTAEIGKIYEAAGWNVETQQYDKAGKPIHWVRVHNLPDFSYFNHSQHVVVGKQTCQTCHGPVETMDVMEQFAPLTMGWCIKCHRATTVSMDGNAYYDKMKKQLEKKHTDQQQFFVKDIGGIECAKCHY